jgi:hypothetical protein
MRSSPTTGCSPSTRRSLTKAGDLVIERHINENKWDVENGHKWLTEDNEENYMYDIQNKDEQ